jgi:hypothetical protein
MFGRYRFLPRFEPATIMADLFGGRAACLGRSVISGRLQGQRRSAPKAV